MKLLVPLLLVFFVFSCSDSGDVDSGNINNTIDSGNVDGGNSDSSDSDDGIVRTWEQFPAFTAGKEVSKRTTIEPTIDGTIIRELRLDYENILRADIDAYANILLADGFTKVKEYNGTYDEYSKYAKSINGGIV